MSDAPEKAYMLCIPMRQGEIPATREVFKGHEKYPAGVLQQVQMILEFVDDALPEDHPAMTHLRGLLVSSGVAATTGAALHDIFARGTFVLQPEGDANG